MSYDRRLEQLCPHQVVDELLLVQLDGQSVLPVRPIASANSVHIRLNAALDVPSMGVYLPATSGGLREGPFDVKPGVNNRLVVSSNGQALQTVNLPAGSQMSTKQMAYHLNQLTSGLQFYEEKNTLKFRSNELGPSATVYIDPSSTLTSTVGFRAGRVFRGVKVAPGWSLINDPYTLWDRPTRMIVFDEPLKGFNDFVEISYATVKEECRRCGGIGVENDWSYTPDGQIIEARDEALLLQEIQKIIYTGKGSNPFFSWYGTAIVELIGQKQVIQGALQNTVTSEVGTSFRYLQSLKAKQETVQFLTDGEVPSRLDGIILEPSSDDPTVIFVTINFQTRARRPIQLTRGIRLPSSMTNLLGT